MTSTIAVDPMAIKPTIIVRTGDDVRRIEFTTKRSADKTILALLAKGYTFDDQKPQEPEQES